jgi:hypothetical protein
MVQQQLRWLEKEEADKLVKKTEEEKAKKLHELPKKPLEDGLIDVYANYDTFILQTPRPEEQQTARYFRLGDVIQGHITHPFS